MCDPRMQPDSLSGSHQRNRDLSQGSEGSGGSRPYGFVEGLRGGVHQASPKMFSRVILTPCGLCLAYKLTLNIE